MYTYVCVCIFFLVLSLQNPERNLPYSTSHYKLATFHVLNSHMWLVATVLYSVIV